MGFDGIYSVYRKNKADNSYSKIAFFDKNGKELSSIFPSRDHILNQMLLGHNRGGYDFESIGGGRGVPDWYTDILKKEHPDWFENAGGYDWTYNPNEGAYYDYLELKGWATNPKCEHIDYFLSDTVDEDRETDSENTPVIRRNPLKSFIEQVNFYLEAYGIYYPMPGEIIIVCEMSY